MVHSQEERTFPQRNQLPTDTTNQLSRDGMPPIQRSRGRKNEQNSHQTTASRDYLVDVTQEGGEPERFFEQVIEEIAAL